MLLRKMLKALTQLLQNPPFYGYTSLPPKSCGCGDFVLVCIILLIANLYVPASHFKHPVFIAHLSNLPFFNSCHQSRVEEALLDWRKGNSWLFLKIGLFFQVFGIHIPQKCMPCSESLAHTQVRQVWPVCHTSKSYLPLLQLLERCNKGEISCHRSVCSKPRWVSGGSARETTQRQTLQWI